MPHPNTKSHELQDSHFKRLGHLRCDDGDATTANTICDSGICQGCPAPMDDCEIAAGTFDPLTQQCTAPTAAADGTTSASETTLNVTRH